MPDTKALKRHVHCVCFEIQQVVKDRDLLCDSVVLKGVRESDKRQKESPPIGS